MSTNNNFCTVRTQDLAYIHWREDAGVFEILKEWVEKEQLNVEDYNLYLLGKGDNNYIELNLFSVDILLNTEIAFRKTVDDCLQMCPGEYLIFSEDKIIEVIDQEEFDSKYIKTEKETEE